MVKTCPECQKTFSTTFCLNRHLRCSHRGERPFQCDHCFLTFGYKHVLLHHIAKKHPAPSEAASLPVLRGQSCAESIPLLTNMTSTSTDPDLGVYVHISRVYLFPVTDEQVVLPCVSSDPIQPTTLPRFEDIIRLKRVKMERFILDA